MAITRPTSLDAVPPVGKRATELASSLAHIDLTKFRFKIGCGMIAAAVLLFVAGSLRLSAEYFTADFPGRAWMMTWVLLGLGSAFSGREIFDAFWRFVPRGIAERSDTGAATPKKKAAAGTGRKSAPKPKPSGE